MPSTKRRSSKAVFPCRRDALVESRVRPNRTAADEDKFVAIDTETGEYELDKNEMKSAGRLWKRVPDPLSRHRRQRHDERELALKVFHELVVGRDKLARFALGQGQVEAVVDADPQA